MKKFKLIISVVIIVVMASLIFYFQKNGQKINGLLLLSENTGDISGYYRG